jgi:predicted transcriptional regulator
LDERRAALAEAIVAAAHAGRAQGEIVQVTGYTREHIRRIVKAAEPQT